MGTFNISLTTNGGFKFELYSDEGEVVLTSACYVAKGGCMNGAESALLNAQYSERYKRKITPEGEHYFLLTGSNGKVISASEMYTNATDCEAGIKRVMDAARGATIYEKLY